MPRIPIPIAGARQVDRAFKVNAQRSVNWYPEIEGDGASAVLTLKPTPGLTLVGQAGNGPRRSSSVEFKGASYFVSGGQLMKVSTTWAITAIGTLNTTTGNCGIVAGRTYLLVVDGGNGYTWNDTTFAVIVDPDFPAAPQQCGYMDGYFIVNNAQSDRFMVSANENPTAWDALDFASAEADPDDAVGVVTSYRDLYLIGTRTTQVYYNSGNADFPFDLYANGVIEFGTVAPFSVARAGGSIYMLAQTKESGVTVVRVNGFQAQKIVDPDLAYTLSRLTTVSDATGFAYTEADQTFYELTFPSEDVTFVYHAEQDMWHERTSEGIGRHRIMGYGRFNGRHLVGDYQNGNLYYLDPTNYTENGAVITRLRRAAVVTKDLREFEVNSFEVEFKRGVGLISGQGSDPMVMLRYSCDGGHTWSSPLQSRLGALGEYKARAIWNRLGQMNNFTPELVITDPVEAIVIAAYADMELLDA